MKDKNTAPKLATPSDLGEEACASISKALNPLVADAFALYIKTKNFHWHMSGPHFRDYHLLLDEQADQIFAMIDVLAERVRKIGKTTIHSIQEIGELKTIKDDNDSFVEAKEMLHRLLNDNKQFRDNMRKAHQIAGDQNDSATTSILEIFLDETERRIWFLFEAHI